MADARFYDYLTGVGTKLVDLGDGTFAPAVALTTGGSTPIGSVAVNSLPQFTYEVSVTPTVTAGTYAANRVIGGIMTFPLILPAGVPNGGILESISLKFKVSLQTVTFNVAIFSGSPAGTFTNGNTAAIAAADSALLEGIYQLSVANSSLGTHTIYNLDGIAKALNGSSSSLYAVVVPGATTGALASTSDMILSLGLLQG